MKRALSYRNACIISYVSNKSSACYICDTALAHVMKNMNQIVTFNYL